jgi:hypothetical protein
MLTYTISDIWLRVVKQGNMVVLFLLFLRKLYTDFHSGCTKLHPYQKCVRISFFLAVLPEFVQLLAAASPEQPFEMETAKGMNRAGANSDSPSKVCPAL